MCQFCSIDEKKGFCLGQASQVASSTLSLSPLRFPVRGRPWARRAAVGTACCHHQPQTREEEKWLQFDRTQCVQKSVGCHLLLHCRDGHEVERGGDVQSAVQQDGHPAEAEEEAWLVRVAAQAGLTKKGSAEQMTRQVHRNLHSLTSCMANGIGIVPPFALTTTTKLLILRILKDTEPQRSTSMR